MNYLGRRLRELREVNGLLLRQVAAQLEMDTALMSKLERGERKMQREQLSEVASALKVGEEELTLLWLADRIKDAIGEDPLATQALDMVKEDIRN